VFNTKFKAEKIPVVGQCWTPLEKKGFGQSSLRREFRSDGFLLGSGEKNAKKWAILLNKGIKPKSAMIKTFYFPLGITCS
jgi:hypothetical protein